MVKTQIGVFLFIKSTSKKDGFRREIQKNIVSYDGIGKHFLLESHFRPSQKFC